MSAPEPFVRYRGNEVQTLASLAFGPDGLYLVPLLPNAQGTSPILRIARDPASGHPFVLEEEQDPVILLSEKGCTHCHSRGADTPNVGPNLAAPRLVPRLMERLNSEGYRQAVGRVDGLEEEPYRSFRGARREVLAAGGLDRVRLWLKYRILEPALTASGQRCQTWD